MSPKPANAQDELRARLREAGLRVTTARLAVLQVLSSSKVALAHGDVATRASGTLDRATVYRNLMDLTEAGLARRTDVGDHVWRFEVVRTGAKHEESEHPHFICGECGTVTCLPEDAVSVRRRSGAPRALSNRGNLRVQIRGTCDACL